MKEMRETLDEKFFKNLNEYSKFMAKNLKDLTSLKNMLQEYYIANNSLKGIEGRQVGEGGCI